MLPLIMFLGKINEYRYYNVTVKYFYTTHIIVKCKNTMIISCFHFHIFSDHYNLQIIITSQV